MNASVIQSMISAIDRPAIYITPDYVIQAVNEAYSDTYETEVWIGRSRCFEISHKNDMPCDQCGEECPMRQCQETLRSTNVVHVHETGEGKNYCDILMRPVVDEKDRLLGYLEIMENITYATHQVEANKMIGISKPFTKMLNMISRVAKSPISVLLQGETGTGKELVAKALHQASDRKDKPFVVIECTGLNDSLFESELFGYEKGAFTGATSAKKGLIESANGGTVFFDEIGDVPLNMQVKLLRLLETRSFRSVGGLIQKSADFRLVCASHKNLIDMVSNGEFRQDLYYRIAGFPIHLPPLRERQEDIPLLISQFLRESGHAMKHMSADAMQFLENYGFPGNIRELKSVVEYAALMSNDDEVHVSDLPVFSDQLSKKLSKHRLRTLEEVEGDYLSTLCEEYTGSLQELADKLKMSVRTLYRKLEKHEIKFSGGTQGME